jgi:outer membrane receptor protein involved in Fe transport
MSSPLPLLLSLAVTLPQDPPPAETVVVAPRSARTATAPLTGVTVVTGEELARTGQRSLPSALAKASGLFVQETNLGGGAPILRGLIGNQVLIVVDGVRLNDSTTRGGPNQSLNSIDAATVERVEVIRGPSSVLYGSDALGGAILIWTRSRPPASRVAGESAEARRIRAELEGQYMSVLGGWDGSLGLSGAFEDDGWLAIGSYHDYGDLTAGDGEEVDNTGYDGNGWFASWEHALGAERTLRFAASRTRDLDVPRTDRMNTGFGQTEPASEEWFYKLQDRERYVLAYDDRSAGGLTDQMQVRLSLRRYQEDRQRLDTGSTTRRLESDQTDTVGLGVDWRKALGEDHLLTWGLDLDFDQVDSVRDDVDTGTGVVTPKDGTFAPDSQYLSSGVFLQDEIFALEPFDVTAGLRYSYFGFSFDDFDSGEETDGSFDALTASLQVARDVGQGSRVTATLAQGFRAPNLADLAKNGGFFAGEELANPDLDPEQSWMAELAWDYVRPTWSVGTAVYYNEIDDAIGARLVDEGDPGTPGDEVYQRDNVGELRYAGVELLAATKLGGADSPWSARVVAESIWGRQFDDTADPNTGEQPFYDVPARRVPPFHGQLALRYEPRRGLWRAGWVELSWAWALEQDELNPGDVADPRIDPDGTDAWNRVDLDLGGPIGEVGQGSSWWLGLHNLLDERYRVHSSGFDAPGFGVVVGVRVAI